MQTAYLDLASVADDEESKRLRASVDDALVALGIPSDQVGLVSVDGEAVPKAKRGGTTLTDGNEMVVMAPLTGG